MSAVPSGTVITAPADGLIYINTTSDPDSNPILSLFNRKNNPTAIFGARSVGRDPVVCVPVQKSDKLILTYEGLSIRIFTFVYALGSAPQS